MTSSTVQPIDGTSIESTPAAGRLIGYARVSTRQSRSRKAQHVDNQVERLYAAGCEIVFTDTVSGKQASRPGWDKCLAYLRPGDVLVFTKLDRIGRSLHNIVRVVEDLGIRHVGLRSLDQGEFDTTTALGKFIYRLFSLLAELEADMARERTLEGMDAARERHGGTLPKRGRDKRITDEKLAGARKLLDAGTPAAAVARSIGISRASLYRLVIAAGQEVSS